MRIVFLIFVILHVTSLQSWGQCCSMGNPASGQESAGALSKNSLRIYSFYKQGRNETYFRENIRLINYGMFSHSSYSFAGLNLAYGLTNRITIEHEVGYFFDKQLGYNDPELDALTRSGYGFANGLLGLQYALWTSRVRSMGLSVAAGVKYPFSSQPLAIDGVDLPVELQPSTGAWGFVGKALFSTSLGLGLPALYVQHRFETNQANYYNYTYGNSHHTTVTLGMPITAGLESMVQLRNEYRKGDSSPTGARLASEGSNVVFLTPTVSVILPANIALSVFADIPLYKYYFGEQLSGRFAAGISLSTEIPLKPAPALR